MNSKVYLDLLMSNQKEVKDGFKFINLKTKEQATIEDCYENIKKDLEVLEILKKRKAVIQLVSNSNGNNTILKETYQFTIGCYDEDYFKIKRWLEE